MHEQTRIDALDGLLTSYEKEQRHFAKMDAQTQSRRRATRWRGLRMLLTGVSEP